MYVCMYVCMYKRCFVKYFQFSSVSTQLCLTEHNYKKCLQNSKYIMNQGYIFCFILFGIPSSLCYGLLKTKRLCGAGGGVYLTDKIL